MELRRVNKCMHFGTGIIIRHSIKNNNYFEQTSDPLLVKMVNHNDKLFLYTSQKQLMSHVSLN